MKKNSIVSYILALTALMPSLGFAQVYYGTQPVSSNNNCISISNTIGLGSRGAIVSTLQVFLANRNYQGSGSWMVTGYYGRATASAVRSFQSEQGLYQSGVVDSATRSAIYNVSCGNVSIDYGTNSNQGYTNQNISWNGYGYSNGYNTNYNNNYNYNTGYNNGYSNGVNLNLTSLSRNTGSYGDSVTVYGTGFDTYGNTLYLGSVAITPSSSNGTSLTFTIPYNAYSGTVDLYVTNSRGKSNTLSFVTSNYGYGQYNNGYYGNNYNNYNNNGCGYQNQFPGYYSTPCQNQYVNNTSAPVSYSLSPSAGSVGTTVTINGSGFSTAGNTIHFGTGLITNVFSYDGRGVSFTVPTQLTGYGTQLVGLGTYPVSVTNAQGNTTNSVSFNVTSLTTGGTASNLSISSITPTYGAVGTVVTIIGSGFTSSNNTIRFGNGAIYATGSSNGTAISFSVPSYLSPYCAANTACPQYVQLVTAGTYPVSIMNTNGTSNTVNYIVQ